MSKKHVKFSNIVKVAKFDLQDHIQEVKNPQSYIYNSPSRERLASNLSDPVKLPHPILTSWQFIIGIVILAVVVYLLWRYFSSKNAKKNLDEC